jgi:hypothetical protein
MDDRRQIMSDHDRMEVLERRMDRMEARQSSINDTMCADHPKREFRPAVPPRVDEVPDA